MFASQHASGPRSRARLMHPLRHAFSDRRALWVLVIAAIAASALSLCLVIPITATAYGKDTKGSPADSELVDVPEQIQKNASLRGGCAHEWLPAYDTIAHPAETHTVEHAAQYATKASFHTMCNECGALIDGIAAEHLKASGHAGFTTDVPLDETIQIAPVWTETVIDKDASTESVQTAWKCSQCGTTKPLDEAAGPRCEGDAL